ncbi:MAG: hypothetical protein SF029_02665 [bacterium]|nr:hypothetical protein [bacterium]
MKKLANSTSFMSISKIGVPCICILLLLSYVSIVYSQICDEVYVVAWSPDGAFIAVSGSEASCDTRDVSSLGIRIFDAETGVVVKYLQGANRRANGLDWSSDGSKLVSFNSAAGIVYIWDVASEQLLITEPLNSQGITLARWQPDTDLIAFGTPSNSIIFFDTTNQSEVTSQIAGTTLDWSPDGTQMVTGSIYDYLLIIWDVSTQQQITSFNQNSASSYRVEWSPDGSKILSSLTDNQALIWDFASEQLLRTIHVDDLVNAHWSPDSNKIATVSLDGTIQVWDANSGYLLDTILGSAPTYDVAWNPDGSQLAYYLPDNDTIIVANPEVVSPTPTPDPTHTPPPTPSFGKIAYSSNVTVSIGGMIYQHPWF